MLVTDIDQLQLGDLVKSVVYTWSQKYMMYEGYEDYNSTKVGTIIFLGDTFFTTKIKMEDGKEVFLAADPGTSGSVTIELI